MPACTVRAARPPLGDVGGAPDMALPRCEQGGRHLTDDPDAACSSAKARMSSWLCGAARASCAAPSSASTTYIILLLRTASRAGTSRVVR